MTTREARRVGSLHFQVSNMDEAVDSTIDSALCGEAVHLHFANAWSTVLAQNDEGLCAAFEAGRVFPDGMPVVWAMRCVQGGNSIRKPARVDGPTFFEEVLKRGVDRGVKHYFFGSTTGTLLKLVENLEYRFPGIDIVGTSSPPFRELKRDDFEKELLDIATSGAHIVWVGLGTPKQDKAAAELANLLPRTYACVGAAFDYTAGNLRMAPQWIQRLGLGWLFRFVQEPRRLFKRYVYGNSRFIWIVTSQLARQLAGGRSTIGEARLQSDDR